MKKSFLFVVCFCLVKISLAQSDVDAIRYSQINLSGTARSLSMGGAFGALGADFSTLSANPAGIAVYRRSEFTITPAWESTIHSSTFLGNTTDDSKFNFNLGNLGIVWAYPKENKKSGWKGWAFGLGYNRLGSYHSRSIYQGVNWKNSLLDSYVEEANADYNNPSEIYNNYPFSSGLAYESYLLDYYSNDTNLYFSVIPNGGELQRRIKETSGSNGEVVLSFGGNYNDVVFWGVTLGFPFLHYHEDVLYDEIDENHTVQFDTNQVGSAYAAAYDFKSFTQAQYLETTGNGITGKFGVIIRPNNWLRIGGAVHFPTAYSLHDDFYTTMSSRFENGDAHSFDSPHGFYDYDLTTPFSFSGSLAFIYKQSGVFDVDYEFVDYPSARLSPSASFLDANSILSNTYIPGNNIKAGAEWKYKIFAFRVGAGYYGGILDESVSSSNTDQHKVMYTGGVGMREEKYFVDLGYAYTTGNEFYRPYFLEDPLKGEVPGATTKITDHRFLLTVGFRF